MKTTTVIQTQRGICAWIARNWELINVNLKLHWAERDLAYRSELADHLPSAVRLLERDLEVLRCRQAVLRNA